MSIKLNKETPNRETINHTSQNIKNQVIRYEKDLSLSD